MKKTQINSTTLEKIHYSLESGFKVIEINVSDSTESLHALVNPIKNNR